MQERCSPVEPGRSGRSGLGNSGQPRQVRFCGETRRMSRYKSRTCPLKTKAGPRSGAMGLFVATNLNWMPSKTRFFAPRKLQKVAGHNELHAVPFQDSFSAWFVLRSTIRSERLRSRSSLTILWQFGMGCVCVISCRFTIQSINSACDSFRK